MIGSPYRFLDPYTSNDRAWFFGRERETEILLADIALSRLVVLFSRTGTGKTSLINAAVIPALQERDFATFLVRLRGGDPVQSAAAVIESDSEVRLDRSQSLAEQLHRVAEVLERPIVVFFDQFEEFFLYQLRDDPERAHAFIADIAQLHRDRTAGVHLVFSLREDFYVELDIFRDHIPTIFHNDSNLRLRWFDVAQARDAMLRPAERAGVQIEPLLADRVIGDLSRRTGRVEPAELQIVCDTLWHERDGGTITLGHYVALGRHGTTATIAEQILNRRLGEQFEVFEDPGDFELLAKLLEPKVLSTDRGTKYVREVGGLARELGTPGTTPSRQVAELRRILDALEDARLVALVARDDLLYVELTHDYLAADPERLRELRRHVRGIWPHRVLHAAHGADVASLPANVMDDLVAVLRRAAAEFDEAAERPERAADHLELDSRDTELLLRLSLHRGVLLRSSFEVARARGVDIWRLLRATIRRAQPPETLNAIDLLGELGAEEDEALRLLADALGVDRFTRRSIAALQKVASVKSVRLIAGTLSNPQSRTDAVAALTALVGSVADPAASNAASAALIAHFRPALARPETARAAIEDLGAVESVDAVELLEGLAHDGEFQTEAAGELGRLAQSWNSAVAKRAEEALKAASAETRRGSRRKERPAPHPTVDEDTYWLIANRILKGRVIPFLGAGANLANRPPGTAWEQGKHPPSGAELAQELARSSRYPEPADNLLQVSQYVETTLGEGFLYSLLREWFSEDYPPNSLHRLHASLPPMLREQGHPYQLIITTNYDDALERAFVDANEEFDLVWYEAKRGEAMGKFLHRSPEGDSHVIERPNEYRALSLEARTVILKIFGTVDRDDEHRDSYVITEDDYIDYLARGDIERQIPLTLRGAMAESHFLFLGYSLRDWNLRVILSRIWGESKLSVKSWAVQPPHPEPRQYEIEMRRWANRGDVELLQVPLNEFVDRLAARLRSPS